MEESVGRRVAEERKLRGWNQERLATEAKVSASLVRKVERGAAPASPAFTAACAAALNLSVGELVGLPYARKNADERRLHATIAPIRRELTAFQVEPEDGIQIRPLDELAKGVARAGEHRRSVNLAQLGEELPGLLAELRAAAFTWTGHDQERAYGLLAEAYAAAKAITYKLGYGDLATMAVDRFQWAAERSGDELAVATGHYLRGSELITNADWAGALRYLERHRADVEPQVARGSAAVLSVWGSLHLQSALAAARAGNADLAGGHFAEAHEAATRVGDNDLYRLAFGPTNVGFWSVGLPVEMMDGTEAVKRSESVRIGPDAPKSRVGHYYIDLARGYLLHGDRKSALKSLQRAKAIAPAQTRFHPMVHETVRQLARAETRSTESVRSFAAWCGVS